MKKCRLNTPNLQSSYAAYKKPRGGKGYPQFTTVENRPPTTSLQYLLLSTSKIIWGHNRGHQPKSNTIKLSKFNSTSYQMRLL
ncbi:hypothetical protein FD644_01645 [Serratia fonticola]|nr:hypothetical protein FD644_01645 [Serratia fonticola]